MYEESMTIENQETVLADVDKTLRDIGKLPSLPVLILEILESINNDQIDIRALVKKISQDQSLVARVMRVANSPFYGLSRQIDSIEQAVIVLGFNSLLGLVTAASIIHTFPPMPKNFDQTEFWRHSVCVAVWAKILAAHFGFKPETAFTAGLLHDIGKLVVVVYFQDGFKLIQKSVAEGMRLRDAERHVVGMDHAMLGRKVAEHWHFPLEICQAIETHDNPLKSSSATNFYDIIYVANLLDNVETEIGELDDGSGYISSEVWARLGLDMNTLHRLSEETKRLQPGMLMLIGEY